MDGLELGRTVATVTVVTDEGSYDRDGEHPEHARAISCRVLAASGDTVALVRWDGSVIFRPPDLVFVEHDDAAGFVAREGEHEIKCRLAAWDD